VSLRRWFQTAFRLSALCLLHSAAVAQQAPITADEVISRYLEAIGANHLSTITTVMETGELNGNVTNFWQGYRSPWQSSNQQHATFETFFKAPNLRFSSSVTEKNQVIAIHGCDGKIGWYIDASLKRSEFKPTAGSEGECAEGFEAQLSRLRQPNTKVRLVKKREANGHMAWEMKVNFPKSSITETYFFDLETFLLVRIEGVGSTSYSDYRDLGGIKVPFTIVQEFTNSKLVTTVREVKINAPIDDARFAEPRAVGGKIELSPSVTAKKVAPAVASTPATTPPAFNPEGSNVAPPESSGAHHSDPVVEVNFPNFTSCTIQELQLAVPELKGLRPSADQEQLLPVLEKVGVKTLDIARNTPNLIARERVTESPQGSRQTRHDYDYIILARLEKQMVTLDEFRLDLKSGQKFQTDELVNADPAHWDELQRASNETVNAKTAGPPMSQGFASSWVHFHPSNRARATYRFLGEENMDGHRTLVLAFAEKPASVLMPAIFRYQDKTAPMFLQGIAWVEPSDFRILRLRTDLLSPVPEVSLLRWTANIQFDLTPVEQLPAPLQLPRRVVVIATVGGSNISEIHEYSGYHLFRAKSRVVLNP
jgi:hypothetical protein